VEEGSPDDVPGQVLHGRLIFRRDAITAEDLESGMTSVGEHVDYNVSQRVMEKVRNMDVENYSKKD